MKEHFYLQTSVDDGGTAKYDDRRQRRKRRRWTIVFYFFFLLSVCLVLILLRVTQWKEKRASRQNRAKKKSVLHNKAIQNDGRATATTRNDNKWRNSLWNKGEDQRKKLNYSPNRRYRWTDDRQLPPIPGTGHEQIWWDQFLKDKNRIPYGRNSHIDADFQVNRERKAPLEWEALYNNKQQRQQRGIDSGGDGPAVDYTKMEYMFQDTILIPPRDGAYPIMEPLSDLLQNWPQNAIDDPPIPYEEKLQHFDFQDGKQMEAAISYRDAEFPFKIYNIPEIKEAGKKWTDDYLSHHFDRQNNNIGLWTRVRGGAMHDTIVNKFGDMPRSSGHCQESEDSFFAFFAPKQWFVPTMGPPPTKDNDWTFLRWSRHARYADWKGIPPTEQHFYYQSGVPKSERYLPKKQWTFVSRDLPSFSSVEATFFSFHPEEQKGIQCRFGERGVTAATHYDAGRNMVAMITGAKRYILSPPNECSKLGIVTKNRHPTFRHSLLNFAHLNLLNDEDDEDAKSMPKHERDWLNLAGTSLAVDTVLRAGEVLYIPSHWFHYIISLQKSAQCNTRSGRDHRGSPEFGGMDDVEMCMSDAATP